MFWSVKEISEALAYKECTVRKIVAQPDLGTFVLFLGTRQVNCDFRFRS